MAQNNRTVIRADAIFLLIAGCIQLTLEFGGHFFEMGRYAQIFGHSPYTIGFFEAHGLAVLIALAVLSDNPKQVVVWQRRLVAVHVLLGGANILFWDSFATFDMVAAGVAATSLHGLFIIANGYYLLKGNTSWEHET